MLGCPKMRNTSVLLVLLNANVGGMQVYPLRHLLQQSGSLRVRGIGSGCKLQSIHAGLQGPPDAQFCWFGCFLMWFGSMKWSRLADYLEQSTLSLGFSCCHLEIKGERQSKWYFLLDHEGIFETWKSSWFWSVVHLPSQAVRNARQSRLQMCWQLIVGISSISFQYHFIAFNHFINTYIYIHIYVYILAIYIYMPYVYIYIWIYIYIWKYIYIWIYIYIYEYIYIYHCATAVQLSSDSADVTFVELCWPSARSSASWSSGNPGTMAISIPSDMISFTIGKPLENHWKTIGKPLENHWKTIGKWRFTIWLWLTVCHGKIHHAIFIGKASISIRAIYTMAM